MPASERSLIAALLMSALLVGCSGGTYELGALVADAGGEAGGGSGSGSDSDSDSDSDSGSDSGEMFTDPFDGASPLKAYVEGLQGAAAALWSTEEGTLLVADTAADAILAVAPGSAMERLSPAGAPIGLAHDRDGSLLIAQSMPAQLVRVDTQGDVATVATLPSPRAIVVTDAGLRFVSDGSGAVYRVDDDGSAARVAELEDPHGLTLSVDQSVLYVAQQSSGQIHVYPIEADGSLAGPTAFAKSVASVDGLCSDDLGNVFAAGPAGLDAFDPAGERWQTLEAPAPLSDCSFGAGAGRTLFVSSAQAVFALVLVHGGAP